MTSHLNRPSTTPTQRFIRSAWAVLLVQLIAAAAAVAVTAWAAFQVRPLLAQRQRLEKEIAAQGEHLSRMEESSRALSARNEHLSLKLANAREASYYVSQALQEYHNRRYAGAIALYDEALKLDPENAYVLDLKSYSQFRGGDVAGAIESVQAALRFQPDYIYGYTEWSRYACAAGRFEEAVRASATARARSSEAEQRYRDLLERDGQFARLCAPVRSRLEGPEGR